MSVKSVFKKKLLKIKNPINSIKKNKKSKHVISESSNNHIKSNRVDKIDGKITTTELQLKSETFHDTNTVQNEITEAITNIKKKRKSIENDANDEQPKKKKVTFSADVKSEKCDQKCTAGNMKPLSLNKRKKKNYIKKLKSKKNKQKNAKKCEENAINSPRQERAIEYLMQWKNDRSNWKFKKIYQLWLIKNTYDTTRVSKEQFEILVEYIETIEGKSRNVILQNANAIVSESSASSEQNELNVSQTNKYHRARTIIQMFA